jgi:hypothetical protein
MEAALKVVQIVRDRSSANKKAHEAAYYSARKAIVVALENLDAAVKGGNQGAAEDAVLQLYKIQNDAFYTTAQKLFATRKADQDDVRAAEDTLKTSFVDLTEDEPDAVKIEDEGVDSYTSEDVDSGGKVRAAVAPVTGTYGPSKKEREGLDDGGDKKRAATPVGAEDKGVANTNHCKDDGKVHCKNEDADSSEKATENLDDGGGKKRAGTTDDEYINGSSCEDIAAAFAGEQVENQVNKKSRNNDVDIDNVKSIKVTGCGFQGANGVYARSDSSYSGAPQFTRHGEYNGESAFYHMYRVKPRGCSKGFWRISVSPYETTYIRPIISDRIFLYVLSDKI